MGRGDAGPSGRIIRRGAGGSAENAGAKKREADCDQFPLGRYRAVGPAELQRRQSGDDRLHEIGSEGGGTIRCDRQCGLPRLHGFPDDARDTAGGLGAGEDRVGPRHDRVGGNGRFLYGMDALRFMQERDRPSVSTRQ